MKRLYHYMRNLKWPWRIVLGAACAYVIADRLNPDNLHSGWHVFNSSLPLLTLLCICSGVLIWTLESLIWKTATFHFARLDLSNALRQVITAQALAFVTPLQSGDYVAKARFFTSRRQRAQAVASNAYTGGMKWLAKALLGLPALAFLSVMHSPQSNWLYLPAAVIVLIMLAALLYPEFLLGQLARLSGRDFFHSLLLYSSSEKLRMLLLTSLKFAIAPAVLSILLAHTGSGDFQLLLLLSLSYYFLVSFLSAGALFDPLLKGGTALLFFELAAYPDQLVFFAVNFVWLFHQALPALGGVLAKWRRSRVAVRE